ncbi:MAG: hypothetical protein ACKVPX_11350 [Myxococcaceae bacterium]
MEGLIQSFDGADGLGWIDLDDGRRVRFGLTACKGFAPTVGTRVRVGGVQELMGKLKATSLEVLFTEPDLVERVWPKALQEFSVEQRWEQGTQREVKIKRVVFDREELRRTSEWATRGDFVDLALHPHDMGAWANVDPPPAHPFFEPWHAEICRTAVGAIWLSPSEGDDRNLSRVGGNSAPVVGLWPECAKGHGPMALLVVVESDVWKPLLGESARMSIHACPACLTATKRVWVGRESGIARVSWLTQNVDVDEKQGAASHSLPEIKLGAKPVLVFPQSWVFGARSDVEGHQPIGGVAAELLAAKLLREGATTSSAKAYDDASWGYDQHYGASVQDIVVGGYSVFRFAKCASCKKPLQQYLHWNDYFTDGAFADLFDGSNELTLLACDRTPDCGGPAQGLLIIDP